MSARSQAQQMAAGAALSTKHGRIKKYSLQGASRNMYESMTENELEEMASTKRSGKPYRRSKIKTDWSLIWYL